jgi:voltage-gated potassium channel
MNNPFISLRKVIILFALVLVAGTLGYRFIEGYNWLQALYMVIQTVSTVGFNEVKPLSTSGIWFTIALIVTSFGTFAFGAGLLAQMALDGSIQYYVRTKRLERKVEKLNNHVIVCGLGRNGRQVVDRLKSYQATVVVIESDEERVERFRDELQGVLLIKGDATLDEVLEKANIRKASSLIAALSSDTDNLFVVISARQLNPNLKIGARANTESTEKKLLAAGANYTVSPNLVGGAHLAHNLMNPGVMNFLDHLSVGGSSATNIEEIVVDELPRQTERCNIKDLEIRQQTGCTVIGYVDEEGNLSINPAPDFEVAPHSKLYVLGNDEQIKALRNWFSRQTQ